MTLTRKQRNHLKSLEDMSEIITFLENIPADYMLGSSEINGNLEILNLVPNITGLHIEKNFKTKVITNLEHIKVLHLYSNKVEEISNLPMVQELNIRSTAASVKIIKNLPKLERLDCNVKDPIVIENFPKLKILTGGPFSAVVNLPKLEELYAYSPETTHMDIFKLPVLKTLHINSHIIINTFSLVNPKLNTLGLSYQNRMLIKEKKDKEKNDLLKYLAKKGSNNDVSSKIFEFLGR